ncbi:MAG: aminopeptidase [Mycobacterium sp.]|uniref:aminopeptidase n=1 Tax=Mycobacterium sp. TaxID=1785 RepID=UPI003C4A3FCC
MLIAGIVGLLLPVSVWNGGNSTIGCGNAIVAEKPAPTTANLGPIGVAVPEQAAHPDNVAQCDSAISSRRHWAIPLVIVGTAGLLVGIFYRGRRKTT